MSSLVNPGRLSVVIPAYNEERAIFSTLESTIAALSDSDFEIVVVDDGSADNTHEKVLQIAAGDPRVKAVRYDLNRGKGYALRCGFETAQGELIAFLDADLDIHPRQLLNFLSIMKETAADVVIGSKLHPLSKLEYPWQRRVISLVYFLLVKALFGLPVLDTQTGIKLFRRNVLTETLPDLKVEGFAFDLELLVLAHQLGYKIVDAPVVLTYQRGFWGRVGLKAIWEVLNDTKDVFLQTRRFKSRDDRRST